jgi:MerR family transcriptional regulator, light-induced transcriptional regulator
MVTSAPPNSNPAVERRQPAADEPLLSIAAVERETGLGKDTLRAWERRYGFPLPRRDGRGIRGYPRALVDRLLLVRRALLAGQRPGRLLGLPTAELDALLGDLAGAPPARAGRSAPLAVADGLRILRGGGAQALRHWLTLGLARTGLASFVVEGLAPLAIALGQARQDGRMAIHEEHLCAEAVRSVLRGALVPFQAGLETSGPRLLLTTLPGEASGLGLLMLEALMTLQACRCLSLGTQTPVADIDAAARAHRIDVVALSFSGGLDAAPALAVLADLRRRLPAAIEVWAGGHAPGLPGSPPAGIRVIARLEEIEDAVARWRGAAAPD